MKKYEYYVTIMYPHQIMYQNDLDGMGEDGWELTAIVVTRNMEYKHIFKRVKQ